MSVAMPAVSVIMPVRDGERYVADALESILQQTVAPGEVVVVNDGSRDGTADVLASFGAALHVVHQDPLGHAAALNRGIAAASGDVLAFLDADDLWEVDSLEQRCQRLRADDAPDAVFGQIIQFVSPDVAASAGKRFHFDPSPSRAEAFDTMLVERRAAERVGPLDVALPSAANIDWISRARFVGLRFAYIDTVVARRRLHLTNMGVTLGDATLQALRTAVRSHHQRHGRGASSSLGGG